MCIDFVRVKAMNNEGTGYGSETNFTTALTLALSLGQIKVRSNIKVKQITRVRQIKSSESLRE